MARVVVYLWSEYRLKYYCWMGCDCDIIGIHTVFRSLQLLVILSQSRDKIVMNRTQPVAWVSKYEEWAYGGVMCLASTSFITVNCVAQVLSYYIILMENLGLEGKVLLDTILGITAAL